MSKKGGFKQLSLFSAFKNGAATDGISTSAAEKPVASRRLPTPARAFAAAVSAGGPLRLRQEAASTPQKVPRPAGSLRDPASTSVKQAATLPPSSSSSGGKKAPAAGSGSLGTASVRTPPAAPKNLLAKIDLTVDGSCSTPPSLADTTPARSSAPSKQAAAAPKPSLVARRSSTPPSLADTTPARSSAPSKQEAAAPKPSPVARSCSTPPSLADTTPARSSAPSKQAAAAPKPSLVGRRSSTPPSLADPTPARSSAPTKQAAAAPKPSPVARFGALVPRTGGDMSKSLKKLAAAALQKRKATSSAGQKAVVKAASRPAARPPVVPKATKTNAVGDDGVEAMREKAKEMLKRALAKSPEAKDSRVSKLARRTEKALYVSYYQTDKKEYKLKLRSLVFNLGAEDGNLLKRVLAGEVEPKDLVKLDSDGLVSESLQAERQAQRDKYFREQVHMTRGPVKRKYDLLRSTETDAAKSQTMDSKKPSS
eukprot:TRINITY_DN15710_c0_g2_i1.p1 TRINITY_DN15710_c0_g2~~TRINITY_DN15710_c0_g2_i1.p1  ORF type:complete len:482 (-),score=107.53 TRINITY_DN15710_c0_g2_i1:177-1622(-)